MATTTVVRTSRTPRDLAFDFVADFTSSQRWDPQIVRARRLDQGPIGLGARFEVGYRMGAVTVPLAYEVTHYERPDRLVLTTRGRLHRGADDVRFEETDGGTLVTWQATFGLRGPGRLVDPLLQLGFPKVAAQAGDELQSCLDQLATRG